MTSRSLYKYVRLRREREVVKLVSRLLHALCHRRYFALSSLNFVNTVISLKILCLILLLGATRSLKLVWRILCVSRQLLVTILLYDILNLYEEVTVSFPQYFPVPCHFLKKSELVT